ncbi:MAG: acyltransferase [Rickettsiales bacterium]|nr:acyltransferase [Rickettsiales bacterium]
MLERERERDEKIYVFDLMRGLASFLLVLWHYFFHCKLDKGLLPALAGTAIFYFISGFVIPMSFERQSVKKFLIKRLFRLYPTIIFILSMSCLFCLAQGRHQIGSLNINFKNILINLTFVPQFFPSNDRNLESYLYVITTWTICVDFTFYILLILTYKITKSHKVRINFIVGLSLVALIIVKILHKKFHIYGAMLQTLTCILPFYFGMASYYYNKNYITKKHFIIISLFIFLPIAFKSYHSRYVIGGLLMLYLLTYHKELGNNKIVRFFAHISYPMFLLHAIVPILIWPHLKNYCSISNKYYFFLLYSAMIPICYFIYRFIEKPCNEFGRKIAAKLR